jgi:hypothetical protein
LIRLPTNAQGNARLAQGDSAGGDLVIATWRKPAVLPMPTKAFSFGAHQFEMS